MRVSVCLHECIKSKITADRDVDSPLDLTEPALGYAKCVLKQFEEDEGAAGRERKEKVQESC